MPRFKIGQNVVALETHELGFFKKNNIVTIDGFANCPNCGFECINIFGINTVAYNLCNPPKGCGHREPSRLRFAAFNFAPLTPIREKIKYTFKVNIPKPEIIEREQLIPLKELES